MLISKEIQEKIILLENQINSIKEKMKEINNLNNDNFDIINFKINQLRNMDSNLAILDSKIITEFEKLKNQTRNMVWFLQNETFKKIGKEISKISFNTNDIVLFRSQNGDIIKGIIQEEKEYNGILNEYKKCYSMNFENINYFSNLNSLTIMGLICNILRLHDDLEIMGKEN